MYKDEKTRKLAETPIPKLLTEMSIPAIIGMLVSAVYNIVDTIFVGRIGTEAIGAVTIAFPLFMAISAIGLTFGVGSASLISRLLGENNKEMANRVSTTSIITTFILGIVLAVGGLYFLRPLLRLFGATDIIMPYAVNYTAIIIFGSIFTMSNMNMNNMVRAEGSAKMSMVALSTGAVLNIILDPILIFYFGMGIAGASAATVFAQAVSTVMLILFYKSEKSVLDFKIKEFKPSLSIYTEIMKIGIPTLIRQLLSSVAMTLLNNMAAVYGAAVVASVGIINRVFSFGFFIIAGFTQGFQPIAGFNFGALKIQRLKDSIKITIKRTTIFGMILFVVFFFFNKQVISFFSRDPEVIKIASTGLRLYALVLPLLGFSITINTLFQALGHGIPATILSFSRQGLFFIPAIFLLSNNFKMQGLFMAQPVADGLTALLTALLFIYVYREIKELEAEEKGKLKQKLHLKYEHKNVR
ncbi:putative MATE family efflux protein [Halanaerobium saccharolyticum]|uniref:Multidrug export protein MepA n=1 Tax=Halanaerobium saccharolyticum TaxID=43595 RepID=A0A4R7YRY4_9FIRM|nr:MATE family efflux transporter [Halanaerobium saccharolyticum]RAK05357.1 putative MATE family efflux protein [Halanaerobium saccharolyticum]TDV99715.1 putative MATE family efflux protein [Halanaerobium saccharolyticum]TDX51872.1 putative MATE family efflux protein [Halanaerobium saccharolyticum]